MSELDPDGQPLKLGFNWNRRTDSRTDELIGVCRGVLADGVLVQQEVEYVLGWLLRNPPVRETYFGRELEEGLTAALSDGAVSADEEERIVDLLLKVIGGTPPTFAASSFSTDLPIDQPPPMMQFNGHVYAFTGKFRFGSRNTCEGAVLQLGADVRRQPTRDTNYLVVGEIGSRDWIHSCMGRKIESAIRLRETGCAIKIVAEGHWGSAVKQGASDVR
jgi:hypothetical protein